MHEAAATPSWVALAYLVAGVCFILSLRGLSGPESSRRGNRTGMVGMAIAVGTTLATHGLATIAEIAGAMIVGGGIGLVTARKIQMTAMPQLVAAFHSLVGMAAVLVGSAAYLNPEAFGIAVRITPIASPSIISIFPQSRIEMGLGVAIGAITFSGSVIAFLKLNGNMSGKPILLPLRHVINIGALVGSSGAILSYIMCRAMNRSFISVIAGGFGAVASGGDAAAIDRPYKRGSAEDAAFLMSQADQVIIVPGYGMAVAQAQHAVREMADLLKAKGVTVKYAIHPVAGRMPGHMNVLLAEANVPYDEVFELEDINSEFAQTDVAYV